MQQLPEDDLPAYVKAEEVSNLEILSDKIKNTPHPVIPLNEKYLLKYLRYNKGDVDKTHRHLVNCHLAILSFDLSQTPKTCEGELR